MSNPVTCNNSNEINRGYLQHHKILEIGKHIYWERRKLVSGQISERIGHSNIFELITTLI